MINYNDLPLAPSMDIRKEMAENLRDLEGFEENEMGEAVCQNILLGYMVLVRDDLLSITKEGYDYFQSIVKTSLN